MLTVLEDPSEIASAQSAFAKAMRDGRTISRSARIGWQGGQATRDVDWDPKLRIWMCFDDLSERGRYWSVFGVQDPASVRGNLSIAVEVNSPHEGVNRRVAGAFARDNSNRLYLLHRGNVGGGRKGIGKSAFMTVYPGAIVTANDENGASNFIGLGRIGSDHFRATLAAFVHGVDRFKSAPIRADKIPRNGFSPEFEGTKIIDIARQIEIQCRHGVIVNTLQRLMESRGFHTENTREIDLRVRRDGQKSIIEVKASDDSQSVYTAIGQLYFNANLNERRLVVLPASCRPQRLEVLRKLGIVVLLYAWEDELPQFLGFDEALKAIQARTAPNTRLC